MAQCRIFPLRLTTFCLILCFGYPERRPRFPHEHAQASPIRSSLLGEGQRPVSIIRLWRPQSDRVPLLPSLAADNEQPRYPEHRRFLPMSMYFRVTANALAHMFAAGALMVGLYALFS